MKGLGTAISIDNFLGHHFYAHTFVHNTSLCIGMDEYNRVWLSNTKKNVGIYLGGVNQE